MAHRGGRLIDTDTLRLFLVLRVSRDGQECEQGSEDNPNVHAHQGKPCDAWEVLALRSVALLTRACPPAIAYNREDTGRTPSAVSSSSNFPPSHSGSETRKWASYVEGYAAVCDDSASRLRPPNAPQPDEQWCA